MMSTMRKNTAIVLWILVFAFIGTIIFSWGMGGFKGSVEPGVLAKVDGVKISKEQYDQVLRNRMAYERENSEQPLNDNRTRQIRDEVWNSLINEILLNRARERAGIQVTDAEIAYAVRNSPPASVMNNPSFHDTTGQFDWAFYRSVIMDPQYVDFVISLEQNIRQQLLQQKLLQRIGSVNYVSEEEARRYYYNNNSSAKASYLLIAPGDIASDTTEVAESELRRLYNDRIEEFEEPEKRTALYIEIPDVPSRQDTVDALRFVERLAERVAEGEDFAELARDYSEDTSADEGGDLGWFGRGRMVQPFEEAAFNAGEGEVVGPVQSRFGYHLIKVHEFRVNDEGAEEVHASHILIKVEQSPDTQEDLFNRASGFQEEANETSFQEAAEVYNLQVDTLEGMTAGGFIPGFGRNQAATEFLFNRPKGNVSPVYRFRQGMVVFQVIEIIPEGFKPFEDVKETLRKDLLMERQMAQAAEKADEVYRLVQELGSIDAVAEQREDLTVRTTQRPFKLGQFISGVGRDAAFGVAAFELEVGEISEPVKGEKGYYIIRLDEKDEADMSNWAARKQATINRLAQQNQQQLFNNWLEGEREEAEIEDYRYLYYTDY